MLVIGLHQLCLVSPVCTTKIGGPYNTFFSYWDWRSSPGFSLVNSSNGNALSNAQRSENNYPPYEKVGKIIKI